MPFKNLEDQQIWAKKYYQEHKDAIKIRVAKYRKDHLDKKREQSARYRAKLRGGPPKQRRSVWSEDNWDDGFIGHKGYFRVYFPASPNAAKGGYVRRSHAVWFIHTGLKVPKGFVIHHCNKNKLDDNYENLLLVSVGEHTVLHCKKEGLHIVCSNCGAEFIRPQWVQNQRIKHGIVASYCSKKGQYEGVKI